MKRLSNAGRSPRNSARAHHAAVARLFSLALLAGAPLVATAACSGSAAESVASGSARLLLMSSSALDLPVGGHLDLTVSGAGISPAITMTLPETPSGYAGTVPAIPAGAGRTFAASLFDASGTVVYAGQVDAVTIEAGKTAIVELFLQPSTAPADFANRAPVFNSVYASTLTAKPGDVVLLAAAATDPEGEAITYRWTATDGTFDDATRAAPRWTAGPASATAPQTLTVAVTDPHGASSLATLTVSNVVTTGSASVSVATNDPPTVSGIVSSSGRLDVGDTTHLFATAVDGDGDALGFYWSTTCIGKFSSPFAQRTDFQLNGTTRGLVPCALTLGVNDSRGGSTIQTLSIQQGPPVAVTAPASPTAPVFDSTTQSATASVSDALITFGAKAHTSTGAAATLSWTQIGGAFLAGSLAADGSSVEWYGDLTMNPSVTVTATDPRTGEFTRKSMTVAQKPWSYVTVRGTISVPPKNAHVTSYVYSVTFDAQSLSNHVCSPPTISTKYAVTQTVAAASSFAYSADVNMPASACGRTLGLTLIQEDASGAQWDSTLKTCTFDPTSDVTSFVCDLP